MLLSRTTTEAGAAAHAPKCDLVATGEHGPPDLTDAHLRALAQHAELTYTCVPLDSGTRVTLDADLDGCYTVTELERHADQRDPVSTPAHCG